MECIHLNKAGGHFRVDVVMLLYALDGCILVHGGDEPHIGAVAVGGSGIQPQDTVFLGHKEDGIVRMFREEITGKGLLRHCVVLSGIHYNAISREGIDTVLSLCEVLLTEVCRELEKRHGPEKGA